MHMWVRIMPVAIKVYRTEQQELNWLIFADVVLNLTRTNFSEGMSNFLTLQFFVTPKEHIQKNQMIDVDREEDAD
jgi:hypothetical protein